MKFKDIKPGEKLSTTLYMEVVSKTSEGVNVRDSYGKEFKVNGINLLESGFKSASQYANTKKVTRTELADILVNLGDQVFKAEFLKQDGTLREITGYKISTENLMGRINVHDLEVKSGHAQRQLDLRTVNWAVVNDTKYTVK